MTACKPVAGLAVGLLGIIGATWFRPTTQLVFNPTDSAPRGWYLVSPAETLQVGDYVIAFIPPDAALFAATRAYLPLRVPILKQIGAVAGACVCARESVVYVHGVPAARTLTTDSDGRALTSWTECRELADDELFLLNPSIPTSFDSRYFGPVRAVDVRGRAVPLWTWSSH